MTSAEERFWKHVQKTAECWLWLGALDRKGYGKFSVRRGSWRYAHRTAWVLANGTISNGLFVCHSCDVRNCVRIEHLFLGTNADNMADCARKGRAPRGERNHSAVLTESVVREIRRRCASGETQRSVAHSYAVAQQSVSDIVNRRLWRHVP